MSRSEAARPKAKERIEYVCFTQCLKVPAIELKLLYLVYSSSSDFVQSVSCFIFFFNQFILSLCLLPRERTDLNLVLALPSSIREGK